MSVRKVFQNYKNLLSQDQIQACKLAVLEILKAIEEDDETRQVTLPPNLNNL
jgi:hypothetical protein